MPRIAEFDGVVLTMYFGDHNPLHFHARYGEHEALLAIDDLQVLRGHLPSSKLALVKNWARHNQGMLRDKWAEMQEE